MSYPPSQFPYSSPYDAAVTMPTPEPNMPTASPSAQQSQQSAYSNAYPTAYPQPPSQAYAPSYQQPHQQPYQPHCELSYQQSYQQSAPAYPPPPPADNFLAVPPSGPYASAPSSAFSHHVPSRPGTPYSALSSTVVASEQTHGASRPCASRGTGNHGGYSGAYRKPSPGTWAEEGSHGSGCQCIIM